MKWQWFTDIFKKMDKTKWMILGLSGILLLVIALPTGSISSTKEDAALRQSLKDSQVQENDIQTYEQELTARLEQTLRCMEGAGQVRVMITFQDSGENIVEKDITKSENAQNSTQYQESSIYGEPDGREPYVSQKKLPAIEGVLVIAQGGGDSSVKQDILDAVQALFPIEAHKIKIVKMQKQS